jgi:hypothetical protein
VQLFPVEISFLHVKVSIILLIPHGNTILSVNQDSMELTLVTGFKQQTIPLKFAQPDIIVETMELLEVPKVLQDVFLMISHVELPTEF